MLVSLNRVSAALWGGMIAVAVILATTSVRLPLICPLRIVTGVPCPLCGMTTGTVATVQGRFGDALAANPFSLLVLPVAIGGIAASFNMRIRSWLAALPRRGIYLGVSAAALASWLFQMHRFGWI